MTLDDCFAKYQGQSVLWPGEEEIDRGQCVQWVEYPLTEVYGQPVHYGNAIDWWYKPGYLLDYFVKVPAEGNFPKKGDFVIWGPGVGSLYGHIDIAMQDGTAQGFEGADSNWGDTNWAGKKTVHLVQHSYANVLGYLRPQGALMSVYDATPTDTDKQKHYKDRLFRAATPAEIANKQTWGQILDDNVTELGRELVAERTKPVPGFKQVTEPLYEKEP